MPKRNRLSRAVGAINLLPRRLRSRSLTLLLGSQVRFAGTARVRIHELGQERAILSLKNRRPVQNHIKGSDENGNQPIACEMVWAWVGKKPRDATAAPR